MANYDSLLNLGYFCLAFWDFIVYVVISEPCKYLFSVDLNVDFLNLSSKRLGNTVKFQFLV